MIIRWTSPATADLFQICDHIHKDNPEAALAVARAIYSGIEGLRRFPRRGRAGRVEGTRELGIASLPYIAVYELSGKTVTVLRILHGAQRWP